MEDLAATQSYQDELEDAEDASEAEDFPATQPYEAEEAARDAHGMRPVRRVDKAIQVGEDVTEHESEINWAQSEGRPRRSFGSVASQTDRAREGSPRVTSSNVHACRRMGSPCGEENFDKSGRSKLLESLETLEYQEGCAHEDAVFKTSVWRNDMRSTSSASGQVRTPRSDFASSSRDPGRSVHPQVPPAAASKQLMTGRPQAKGDSEDFQETLAYQELYLDEGDSELRRGSLQRLDLAVGHMVDDCQATQSYNEEQMEARQCSDYVELVGEATQVYSEPETDTGQEVEGEGAEASQPGAHETAPVHAVHAGASQNVVDESQASPVCNDEEHAHPASVKREASTEILDELMDDDEEMQTHPERIEAPQEMQPHPEQVEVSQVGQTAQGTQPSDRRSACGSVASDASPEPVHAVHAGASRDVVDESQVSPVCNDEGHAHPASVKREASTEILDELMDDDEEMQTHPERIEAPQEMQPHPEQVEVSQVGQTAQGTQPSDRRSACGSVASDASPEPVHAVHAGESQDVVDESQASPVCNDEEHAHPASVKREASTEILDELMDDDEEMQTHPERIEAPQEMQPHPEQVEVSQVGQTAQGTQPSDRRSACGSVASDASPEPVHAVHAGASRDVVDESQVSPVCNDEEHVHPAPMKREASTGVLDELMDDEEEMQTHPERIEVPRVSQTAQEGVQERAEPPEPSAGEFASGSAACNPIARQETYAPHSACNEFLHPCRGAASSAIAAWQNFVC